jgi:c-di-GMP-binding flagellar brake protein YcgR
MFFKNTSSPEPGLDRHSTAERITKAALIARNLQRLKDGRCLLDIRIPGLDEHFNSAILRIYPSRDLMILDELNQPAGHAALVKVKKLQASCRLNGVEYRFATRVTRIEEPRGGAIYHVQLPKLMLHIQRRNHYRVPVTRDAGLELRIPLQDDPKLKANLFDLSSSGLGIRLNSLASLQQGQTLPVCSIVLPDGELIRSDVEIRFVRADNLHKQMRVGGHFINMDRALKSRLITLIKSLERLYLRTHPH